MIQKNLHSLKKKTGLFKKREGPKKKKLIQK